MRLGLHIRIAVGFKLELEAAEADGRLNDANRDNLAIARSRVDILESGNGPNRYDEVLVGLRPGGNIEYLLAGAPNTPAPIAPPVAAASDSASKFIKPEEAVAKHTLP